MIFLTTARISSGELLGIRPTGNSGRPSPSRSEKSGSAANASFWVDSQTVLLAAPGRDELVVTNDQEVVRWGREFAE